MKRTALALALIVVTLLTSATAAAIYVSVNNSHQAADSLPSASPAPTPTPTSTPTPTPTSTPSSTSTPTPTPSPTPTPKPNPTSTPSPTPFPDSSYTENGWLPLGVFGVTSPTNQTYNTNSLLLNVSGTILVGMTPSLAYSLDGGPRVPIPIELKQTTMMQVSISGSVALSPLANGSHVIVVYGDLIADAKRSKVTVYFEVAGT